MEIWFSRRDWRTSCSSLVKGATTNQGTPSPAIWVKGVSVLRSIHSAMKGQADAGKGAVALRAPGRGWLCGQARARNTASS